MDAPGRLAKPSPRASNRNSSYEFPNSAFRFKLHSHSNTRLDIHSPSAFDMAKEGNEIRKL